MASRITGFKLPLFAILAFVGAVVLVWRSQPRIVTAEPLHAPPVAVFTQNIAAIGLVEPTTENIAISTPVSGLVMTVAVQAGARVAAGQPLFTLDTRDLTALLKVKEQQLAVARAQLARLEQAPRREELPPAQAKVGAAEQMLADARVQQQLIEGVSDPRAIRQEDLLRRRVATKAAEARLAEAQARLQLLQAGAWQPDLEIARSQIALAEAEIEKVRADIARLTIVAPGAGDVLRVNIRAGEYAQSGTLKDPLIVFGDITTLHVRADVDEQDAHRVAAGAAAYASPRGDSSQRIPLEFVRYEPYVVPKRSLTGDVSERVDTRVLQVIYRIRADAAPLFVGQQVDVYIDSDPAAAANAKTEAPATPVNAA